MTLEKMQKLMNERDYWVSVLQKAKLEGDGRMVTNARRQFSTRMNKLRPYLLKYLNYNKPAK